jgi:nucleotide-binding universal stress UspA family protein
VQFGERSVADLQAELNHVIAMKNLLVPVDFSDASNLLVEKAGELAQELTARVVLLHVDEPKATHVGSEDAGWRRVAVADS